MQSPRSVCPSSVPLFSLYPRNRLTVDLELLHVSRSQIKDRRGSKVKISAMGQANAVGPTSIDGSFFQLVLVDG